MKGPSSANTGQPLPSETHAIVKGGRARVRGHAGQSRHLRTEHVHLILGVPGPLGPEDTFNHSGQDPARVRCGTGGWC
jgi:hypothetical protein